KHHKKISSIKKTKKSLERAVFKTALYFLGP
ncbi:hypothetical protein LCGC14_2332780, partial [marine sediment metagenome]